MNDRQPFADLKEIEALQCSAVTHEALWAPSLWAALPVEIQEVYNGAGPDSMAQWKRKTLTFLLRHFKIAIIGHDWRYTQIVEFKQQLKNLVGRSICRSDLIALLNDWNFQFNGQTKIFLSIWPGRFFTPDDYDNLMRCLWHDTNREFFENMKIYCCVGWQTIFWPWRRFKARAAYLAVESDSGWTAWLS